MKKITLCMMMLLAAGFCALTYGQEVAMVTPHIPAGLELKAPTEPANAEVTLTLKNSATHTVCIFAGAKEDIRNPKIQVYGGLSRNTLYLYANDVVCLMTEEKKPMACTNVQGFSQLEIDPSGLTIAGKK
jgi:hypothetical protein